MTLFVAQVTLYVTHGQKAIAVPVLELFGEFVEKLADTDAEFFRCQNQGFAGRGGCDCPKFDQTGRFLAGPELALPLGVGHRGIAEGRTATVWFALGLSSVLHD